MVCKTHKFGLISVYFDFHFNNFKDLVIFLLFYIYCKIAVLYSFNKYKCLCLSKLLSLCVEHQLRMLVQKFQRLKFISMKLIFVTMNNKLICCRSI